MLGVLFASCSVRSIKRPPTSPEESVASRGLDTAASSEHKHPSDFFLPNFFFVHLLQQPGNTARKKKNKSETLSRPQVVDSLPASTDKRRKCGEHTQLQLLRTSARKTSRAKPPKQLITACCTSSPRLSRALMVASRRPGRRAQNMWMLRARPSRMTTCTCQRMGPRV